MADREFTIEELASEIWKPVPSWEGVYSVSNLGRVRRDMPHPTNGWGVGNILKPSPDGKGYNRHCLSGNRRKQQAHAYALVAAAFLGPRPPGFHVDHIDAVKTNDRLKNLEYVTEAENHRRAAVKGLYGSGKRNGKYTKPERTPRGANHPLARIGPDKAQTIFALRAQGQTLQAIADHFNVSATTIRNVLYKDHWSSCATG